jgi:hypothetical protein
MQPSQSKARFRILHRQVPQSGRTRLSCAATILISCILGLLVDHGFAAAPTKADDDTKLIVARDDTRKKASKAKEDSATAATIEVNVSVENNPPPDLATVLAEAFDDATVRPSIRLAAKVERASEARYLVTFPERPRNRVSYPGGTFDCSAAKCNGGVPISIKFVYVYVSIQLDRNATGNADSSNLSYALEARATDSTRRFSRGLVLIEKRDSQKRDGQTPIKEELTIPEGWLIQAFVWVGSEPRPRSQFEIARNEIIFDFRTTTPPSDDRERASSATVPSATAPSATTPAATGLSVTTPVAGNLGKDYRIALIPRDTKKIDQLEQAIAAGRIEIVDADPVTKALLPTSAANGSRQQFQIGTQTRQGILLGPMPLADPSKVAVRVDAKTSTNRLPNLPEPRGNTLVFEVPSLEPPEQPLTVRLRPVEMLYVQQVPIDTVAFEGCKLTLKAPFRPNQNIEMKVEGKEIASSAVNVADTERRALPSSMSVTIGGEQKRVGGDCPHLDAVAGSLVFNESKRQITGVLEVNMRPSLLLLAAPQRMSAGIPGGLEVEVESRVRELWRSVLAQLDQWYRRKRDSLLTGDLILLSSATTPAPLTDRFVAGGLKSGQAPVSLEVSDAALAALLAFEETLSAPPEAGDVVTTITAYRKLHRNSSGRSIAVVLGAALTNSTQQVLGVCQRWSTELAALRSGGASSVAFLAVGLPGAEIGRALKQTASTPSSLPGGLFACPAARPGDGSLVYLYSFRDLIENPGNASRQIGELAETIQRTVSRETLQ